MSRCGLIFWFAFLHTITVIVGCERPLEVRGVEDYCWTKKVEVRERIQYTGKSVLNFAKKTLGMDIETDEEPQKCDYYTCIFQELKVMNGDGYPCHERMTKWVKNNVIYNHATILLSQIDKCTEGLSKSITSETKFVGDKIGESASDEDTPSENQSKCDIAAEYMKCMSIIEKDEKCPIFQYP